MARMCESIGRVSAYVEDLVSQRPRVKFYYEGQAVSVRVPRSPRQVAYTYSRLRSAFKLADDVIISAFFVDTHNGGPLCPFRLVAMLRGGEVCSLVTVPRLIHPPSELPLPPQRMRPELVEWHTVCWVKLQHIEERERAAETARMIAALETEFAREENKKLQKRRTGAGGGYAGGAHGRGTQAGVNGGMKWLLAGPT